MLLGWGVGIGSEDGREGDSEGELADRSREKASEVVPARIQCWPGSVVLVAGNHTIKIGGR